MLQSCCSRSHELGSSGSWSIGPRGAIMDGLQQGRGQNAPAVLREFVSMGKPGIHKRRIALVWRAQDNVRVSTLGKQSSPQIESSRSSLATTTGTRDARPNARATQQFRPETPPGPAQRQPLVTPTRRSIGPANWPRRGILAAWRPMRWHFETTVGSGRMHDPQLLNKPDQLSRVLEETQKKKI